MRCAVAALGETVLPPLLLIGSCYSDYPDRRNGLNVDLGNSFTAREERQSCQKDFLELEEK